ncbi:MAG TPA: hypothetical protein VF230_13280 [Acidimicrobiales bacterium]
MTRRHRTTWGLAFMAAALAVTQFTTRSADADGDVGPPPAPGAAGPAATAGVTVQTPAEARAQDLALVAEAQGWTIDQAATSQASADAVGTVAAQLAAARPDAFVGSVVSLDPEGTPELYVKGAITPDIAALAASSPVPIRVVGDQPYSFDELDARKLAVHDALQRLGFVDVVTGFNVGGRGAITAAVTRVVGLPAASAAIVAALPPSLRTGLELTVTDDDVVSEEHAFGGMQTGPQGCTSGWSVFSPFTGVTGVTLADHCNETVILEPNSVAWALARQGEHTGAWGEVEWHTTSHSEPARFYASQSETRRTVALEPRAAISENESVCLYGRASNSRQCLPVAQVSYACGSMDRLVRMGGDVGTDGDSGGGWSSATTAFGSHFGDCANNDVFSVADLYDEALGVWVRLSDTLPTRVVLHEEDSLVSRDGRFAAIMQNDGNFVVYHVGVGPIWATGTQNRPGAQMIMQHDGNLVIYWPGVGPIWSTGTSGSGHALVMQNDGNLVMYAAGVAQWHTNTGGREQQIGM